MAETQMVVASAVLLPDVDEQTSLPDGPVKRRQSATSEGSNKRLRLDQEQGGNLQETKSTTEELPSKRRRSGQMEERKRGQRLFGALLGTLSQSSSSTAQKRRVDIEKKQQAKLKLQAEEYDEKKKIQLDALLNIRQQEQKKYQKQSMQIRHSNLLAAAQFLQTKAEPKLFYKPWELLPGDEARIKHQIEEAEKTVERESSQLDLQQSRREQTSQETRKLHAEPDDTIVRASQTVGPLANQVESDEPLRDDDTNPNRDPLTATDGTNTTAIVQEASKDSTDDGGEVVLEAEEDTVIY